MNTRTKIIFFSVLTFCVQTSSMPALAHHSFSPYDNQNPIEISGTLTRLDFIQPHILLALDRDIEEGTAESWRVETLQLRRWNTLGLDQDFVSLGDQVTLVGWPARNGDLDMHLKAIVDESGAILSVRESLGD